MLRRLLIVVLATAALFTAVTPAKAGLLDSLLGGSNDDERAAPGDEGTSGAADACQPTTIPVIDVGLGSCSGLRPGSQVVTDNGSCTLNFVFTGSDGERYMGTAGHCILSTLPINQNIGEETFAESEGPEARDAEGNRIGEFAYAIQEAPRDFGLIRLDDDVEASPQVAQFGGPTGVNDEITTEPTLLSLFGNPLGIGGPLASGRTLVAIGGLPDPDSVAATGVSVQGDSGGPVLDQQGRAVGVLVTGGPQLTDALLRLEALDTGIIGISRLTPQLEQAERALGVDMTLQTAPQL